MKTNENKLKEYPGNGDRKYPKSYKKNKKFVFKNLEIYKFMNILV